MKLKNLPRFDFVTADPIDIEADILKTCEALLGRTIERADPIRLLIKTFLAVIVQQRLLIDETAKQNLLAYATGINLDRIGDLVGATRLAATAAVSSFRVRLSAPRSVTTTINAGTRITADYSTYFALDDACIFNPGEVEKVVSGTCLSYGEIGNGFMPGELCKVVDPQPFLESIVNTTTSDVGSEPESDDHFRERIHEAPESFSVAGPEGAYRWHTRAVSSLISDVAVDSSAPTKVEVYFLTKSGLPTTEMINTVFNHLNDVRPLTDQLTVLAPNVLKYKLIATFFVSKDDSLTAAAICEAANQAALDYTVWQAERIGRDLNPDELIARLKTAGVKRVVLSEPSFQVLNKLTVAICEDITLTYGGLEEE